MGEIVFLGEISCPSGELVIVDGGTLGMWSGRRSPGELDPRGLGIDDPQLIADISGSVDYVVVGPDAGNAAASFARRPTPYHYDIPASRAAEWADQFAQHCHAHGWNASVQTEAVQVPHRERAHRCAVERLAGFRVFGLPAVAIDGLPTTAAVRVEARRSDGPWHGWSEMTVRVRDTPVAATTDVGSVGVDAARLAFADADALTHWHHDEPLDGLADVAFWGGTAAATAAAEFSADRLTKAGDEGSYGWTNLPIRSALQRARTIEVWKNAEPSRRMALDFRPHSHHWQVMQQVRASDNETGSVTIGDAQILFAMTSWGDGVFPVHADRDAAGDLVSLRVTLTEQ
ncbi:hypothetical protein ACFFWC_00720 [Plantactinospora siamensis]|uniref:Uncharacterized protein n=1 Tax=Plantactinospora siamensis TaxID=555372 RepID=A0ABV6NVN2_9ACTN